MIKEPEIVLISNPTGQDGVIQSIQIALDGVLWLTSLGKAYTGRKTYSEKEIIYPAIYQGNGEYYDALPNDNLKGQSFIRINDPATPIDYNPFGSNIYTAPTSIIVWYNLKEVKKVMSFTYDYRFDEVLKQEVLNVLKRVPNIEVLRIFEKPEEVFKGYTLNHLERQSLFYPYGGFRIDINLSYTEEC